jgi:two-component system, NarL family, sensor kinase
VEAHIDLQSEIPNETGLNLYRILQELINNTMKHAHASKINIELSQVRTEYISFIYEDNGNGFSISQVNRRGMGIRNIRARVEKMNGQVTFGEKSSTGFSSTFEIPLP